MRNVLAAGSLLVGLALLSAACGVEPQPESNGVKNPMETSEDQEALSVPSGEPDSCASVQAWVEQNRARLPTDYDKVGQLPWTYRRAVFGALSPATRSALFQSHYERYAQEHTDMSSAQRAVLEHAKELMTPDVYALSHESPEWQERVRAPQEELERQARAVFDPEEVAKIFFATRSRRPDRHSGAPGHSEGSNTALHLLHRVGLVQYRVYVQVWCNHMRLRGNELRVESELLL